MRFASSVLRSTPNAQRQAQGAAPCRIVIAALLIALWACCARAQSGQPPRAALPYRADLIRTARAAWGLNAPVPVFAAQIHTESGWRPDAVSPVGALGLAQFMPATARWIAAIDPQLSGGQPYNPAWAMRALVTYDKHLYGLAPARYTARERMWVALRGYNGGLGNWQAEARATGLPAPTRGQVDAACGKAGRAAAHCAENLAYPRRVLIEAQPRYALWGPVL